MNRKTYLLLALIGLTLGAGASLAQRTITLQPGETVTITAATQPTTKPADPDGPTTKPTDPTTRPADPDPTGDLIADLAATLRAAEKGREPTAAEIKAVEQWVLTKGAYAPPAGVATTTIQPGSDLTKLGAGHYWAPPGVYPYPNGKVVAHVYAVARGTCTITGKPGDQGRIEGGLYGFAFNGGGKNGGDNHNAGLLIGSGASFIGGSFKNAVGVGVAGGQVKIKDGKEVVASADDAKIIGNLFEDNAASGSGGKFKRGQIAYNVFRGNNKGKDGDGADIGKMSRCDGLDIHHNVCSGGWFAGVWFDINNANTKTRSNVFAHSKKIDKDYQGVGIKHEIGSPNHEVTDNIIYGQHGPAIVLNETRDVKVLRNVLKDGLGPEGAVFHCRQLDRADENTRADVKGAWRLGNVVFDENFLITGRGKFTRSGAGTKLTQDLLRQWGVVVGTKNVGTVEIKF